MGEQGLILIIKSKLRHATLKHSCETQASGLKPLKPDFGRKAFENEFQANIFEDLKA